MPCRPPTLESGKRVVGHLTGHAASAEEQIADHLANDGVPVAVNPVLAGQLSAQRVSGPLALRRRSQRRGDRGCSRCSEGQPSRQRGPPEPGVSAAMPTPGENSARSGRPRTSSGQETAPGPSAAREDRRGQSCRPARAKTDIAPRSAGSPPMPRISAREPLIPRGSPRHGESGARLAGQRDRRWRTR